MASRLSGIDSTNTLRHLSHKNPQNIENGNSEDKSKLIWPSVNLSGTAMPNPPQRGANQKFGSDNDVWSQKLNFFYAKKPLQIQYEKN